MGDISISHLRHSTVVLDQPAYIRQRRQNPRTCQQTRTSPTLNFCRPVGPTRIHSQSQSVQSALVNPPAHILQGTPRHPLTAYLTRTDTQMNDHRLATKTKSSSSTTVLRSPPLTDNRRIKLRTTYSSICISQGLYRLLFSTTQ